MPMLTYKCYKVYQTDVHGDTTDIYVPVNLLSTYLDNALADSRVVIHDIVNVKIYSNENLS